MINLISDEEVSLESSGVNLTIIIIPVVIGIVVVVLIIVIIFAVRRRKPTKSKIQFIIFKGKLAHNLMISNLVLISCLSDMVRTLITEKG